MIFCMLSIVSVTRQFAQRLASAQRSPRVFFPSGVCPFGAQVAGVDNVWEQKKLEAPRVRNARSHGVPYN